MIDRERLDAMRVPRGLRDAILSPGFDWARPAVATAQRFAGSRAPLLVLAGPTQVGKSCAAAIGAAEARTTGRLEHYHHPCEPDTEGAARGINGAFYVLRPVEIGASSMPAMWIHAPQFFDHIFDEPYWTKAARIGALVIDDLGLEPQDARVRDRVIGLLVGRYDDARPTIVTTNLTASAFRGTYGQGAGERLVARLGGGAWVQIAGRAAA